MDTAKDLFENEELMNSLVEDLEETVEDHEVFYSVWAIGYDKDYNFTEDDFLIGEFDSLDKAVACAEAFTLETSENHPQRPDTSYISIEVDTVISCADGEDCGTMTVNTVYHREVSLTGEPDKETGLDGDPIIAVTSNDCEILEDNTLKIRKEILSDFNKNDEVNIYFADDSDSDILRCKIVSDKDGYYFCELVF